MGAFASRLVARFASFLQGESQPARPDDTATSQLAGGACPRAPAPILPLAPAASAPARAPALLLAHELVQTAQPVLDILEVELRDEDENSSAATTSSMSNSGADDETSSFAREDEPAQPASSRIGAASKLALQQVQQLNRALDGTRACLRAEEHAQRKRAAEAMILREEFRSTVLRLIAVAVRWKHPALARLVGQQQHQQHDQRQRQDADQEQQLLAAALGATMDITRMLLNASIALIPDGIYGWTGIERARADAEASSRGGGGGGGESSSEASNIRKSAGGGRGGGGSRDASEGEVGSSSSSSSSSSSRSRSSQAAAGASTALSVPPAAFASLDLGCRLLRMRVLHSCSRQLAALHQALQRHDPELRPEPGAEAEAEADAAPEQLASGDGRWHPDASVEGVGCKHLEGLWQAGAWVQVNYWRLAVPLITLAYGLVARRHSGLRYMAVFAESQKLDRELHDLTSKLNGAESTERGGQVQPTQQLQQQRQQQDQYQQLRQTSWRLALELVGALRDSCLLDHWARAALLCVLHVDALRSQQQGSGNEGGGADQDEIDALEDVVSYFPTSWHHATLLGDTHKSAIRAPSGSGRTGRHGDPLPPAARAAYVQALLGHSTQHLLLSLGVRALCTADGGPQYGMPLPYNTALCVKLEEIGDRPHILVVRGHTFESMACMLALGGEEERSGERRPGGIPRLLLPALRPARRRLSLLLRMARLAVRSAEAFAGPAAAAAAAAAAKPPSPSPASPCFMHPDEVCAVAVTALAGARQLLWPAPVQQEQQWRQERWAAADTGHVDKHASQQTAPPPPEQQQHEEGPDAGAAVSRRNCRVEWWRALSGTALHVLPYSKGFDLEDHADALARWMGLPELGDMQLAGPLPAAPPPALSSACLDALLRLGTQEPGGRAADLACRVLQPGGHTSPQPSGPLLLWLLAYGDVRQGADLIRALRLVLEGQGAGTAEQQRKRSEESTGTPRACSVALLEAVAHAATGLLAACATTSAAATPAYLTTGGSAAPGSPQLQLLLSYAVRQLLSPLVRDGTLVTGAGGGGAKGKGAWGAATCPPVPPVVALQWVSALALLALGERGEEEGEGQAAASHVAVLSGAAAAAAAGWQQFLVREVGLDGVLCVLWDLTWSRKRTSLRAAAGTQRSSGGLAPDLPYEQLAEAAFCLIAACPEESERWLSAAFKAGRGSSSGSGGGGVGGVCADDSGGSGGGSGLTAAAQSLNLQVRAAVQAAMQLQQAYDRKRRAAAAAAAAAAAEGGLSGRVEAEEGVVRALRAFHRAVWGFGDVAALARSGMRVREGGAVAGPEELESMVAGGGAGTVGAGVAAAAAAAAAAATAARASAAAEVPAEAAVSGETAEAPAVVADRTGAGGGKGTVTAVAGKEAWAEAQTGKRMGAAAAGVTFTKARKRAGSGSCSGSSSSSSTRSAGGGAGPVSCGRRWEPLAVSTILLALAVVVARYSYLRVLAMWRAGCLSPWPTGEQCLEWANWWDTTVGALAALTGSLLLWAAAYLRKVARGDGGA